jgi:hypothetical protein
VTRGAYALTKNQTGAITFQLFGGGWQFLAGHTIRLELLNSDTPWVLPSHSLFTVTVSDLTVELPSHQPPDGGEIVTPILNPEPAESPAAARCPSATGRLTQAALGRISLGMTRAQARRAYTHSSDHGKRYQDYFCLTPTGIRVGYASSRLLNALPAPQREQLTGRVIWASTSNPYYTVDGIRPGETLAAATTHLTLTGAFPIGLNDWYLAPNGSSTAVLKIRHDMVEEIGLCDKSLTHTHTSIIRFLRSFT